MLFGRILMVLNKGKQWHLFMLVVIERKDASIVLLANHNSLFVVAGSPRTPTTDQEDASPLDAPSDPTLVKTTSSSYSHSSPI